MTFLEHFGVISDHQEVRESYGIIYFKLIYCAHNIKVALIGTGYEEKIFEAVHFSHQKRDLGPILLDYLFEYINEFAK